MEGGSTPAGAAATGRTIERRGAAMRKRKTRRRTEGGIENMIRADAGEGHAGRSFLRTFGRLGVFHNNCRIEYSRQTTRKTQLMGPRRTDRSGGEHEGYFEDGACGRGY